MNEPQAIPLVACGSVLFTDELARREVKARFQPNCPVGSPLTSAIGPVAEDQGEIRAALVHQQQKGQRRVAGIWRR